MFVFILLYNYIIVLFCCRIKESDVKRVFVRVSADARNVAGGGMRWKYIYVMVLDLPLLPL